MKKLLMLAVFLIATLPAFGQSGYGLEGASGAYVLIEGLVPEFAETNITKDRLRQRVQLRLRQNDIKVYEDFKEGVLAVYLNINAHTIENKRSEILFYVFNVELQVIQRAYIGGENPQAVIATTWDKSMLGYCATGIVNDEVMSAVDIVIEGFLNQYLADNAD